MPAFVTNSGKTWLGSLTEWLARHPGWVLTVAGLVLLTPFLNKPFNVDDPLFIWSARQIQAHPANPYGFTVNWYGRELPMWVVTKNPPLACYYLAATAAVFGWSEVALHAACLLPALAVIWGTYRLARHFCRHPLLAALATLFTPVFLISSTTVMCDVLMLAFWIWAGIFWLEGLEQDDFRRILLAGLLLGLAALTKYFGICLLPLLLAYTLILKREPGRWIVGLLFPLVMLCAYQWAAWIFYDAEFLVGAADYATSIKASSGSSLATSSLTGLAFTGGCLPVALFLAPVLWRARVWLGMALGITLVAAVILTSGNFLQPYLLLDDAIHATLRIQVLFWALAGGMVLALALAEIKRERSAQAWLLGLWVLGTFIFAVYLNWTINGRSLLPVAPALGILIARRWERLAPGRKSWSPGLLAGLAASAALAWFTTQADYRYATAVRQSAGQICATCRPPARPLWFEGHWGFQYYMAAHGATALDTENSSLLPGDTLAIPDNNSNLIRPEPDKAVVQQVFNFPHGRWLTTFSEKAGAGFYTSLWGPVPFVFGYHASECISIYTLGAVAQPATNSDNPGPLPK